MSTSLPTPTHPFDPARALQLAREALRDEAHALVALSDRVGDSFVNAVSRILATPGRVVVMGMGKSGHVGRKIAATLASTGTPAFFVHPAEASHGDLGMVTQGDLVLGISNSGEANELTVLLPVLKRPGVQREACPLSLAPTTSTTAQMALGDALAVALLDARGFRAEDFARSHPGGALGRKLLTLVRDVMRSGDELPRVSADASFSDLMREMSAKSLGASTVVDAEGHLLGIFTDGDLRRRIESGGELLGAKAGEVMHTKPRTIRPQALAADAAALMEQHSITSVLVTDEQNKLLGMVHIGDLMRAKVI